MATFTVMYFYIFQSVKHYHLVQNSIIYVYQMGVSAQHIYENIYVQAQLGNHSHAAPASNKWHVSSEA